MNTGPNQHDVTEAFRIAAAVRGIIIPNNPVIGRLSACKTEDKPRSKNGRYLLYLDGLPAGGFQNMSDGQGWQKWRFRPGRKWNPTPAERAAIVESQRRWRIKQDLELWTRRETRRVGLLIFQFNQIEMLALERLALDADDKQALFSLSICCRRLPRLEHQHDLLLSRNAADWLDVFRHSRASGKTDRRAA